MSKVLFLQEHVRTDHTIHHNNGDVTISFLDASTGKRLLTETNKHGITRRDIDIAYVYPKVPEPARVSNAGNILSYKDVALGKASEYHGQLTELIVKDKPEVVVPNGRLGCKFLIDVVSITQNRGIPVQKTLENEAGESHTFWVLPIYSMEFLASKPSIARQVEMDLGLLKQFLDEGESAFLPSEVEYDYVGTIEEVREIFNNLKQNKPTTSWDLETNTLKPEMDGAKALVLTLSWEEKTGVVIPMEHKEFTWEEEEFEELLELFKDFVADKDIPKVGANIKFDIRFMISAYGFKHFNNNMDVQIGYWMTVSQERDGSRRLSNLAYEFTDMGGYDDELEEWIAQYKKDYRSEHKKKPENEIDGSDFNYEWIPFDTLIEYAAGDADVTLRVHNKIMERVKTSDKWVQQYTEFYPRMSAAIAQTEANGLHLDLEYARETAKAYRKEEARLVEAMRKLPSVKIVEEEHREFYERGLKEWEVPPAERDKEIANWRNKYKNKLEFNPRSGADKGKVLFDVLNIELPLDKDFVKDKAWTDKNPRVIGDLSWEDFSTNRAVLEEVISGNYSEEAKTLANLMIEYSSVATLRSTFADKAEDDMADDGAIHGSLNIVGTGTSRLSSSQPKLDWAV